MRRLISALIVIAFASPAAAADPLEQRARAAYGADDFAAAADLFAAAPPPLDDPALYGAALIRLHRGDQAASLLNRADPAMTARLAARAFRLAGQTGAARSILAQALESQPQDAGLLAEAARTETAAGRIHQALAPALRAAELAPTDAAIQAATMQILLQSAMPVRALKSFQAAQAVGLAVTEPLVLLEIQALQAVGDHAGAVNTAETFMAEHGISTAVQRQTLQSLTSIGAAAKLSEWKAQISKAPTIIPALSAGAVLARKFQDNVKISNWDGAARIVRDWINLRPDSIDAARALIQENIAERMGWGVVFDHVARLVEADPLSPDRRLFAAQAHAGAGGNSILSLTHLHALDDLVAADDPRASTARTLRDKVLRGLTAMGKVEDLSLSQSRLKLSLPAGGFYEMSVHPRTGRIISFAASDYRMQAQWDADGALLQSLTDSNGAEISLNWKDGQLIGLSGRGFDAEIRDGQPRLRRGDAKKFSAALAAAAAWNRADLAAARWLRL